MREPTYADLPIPLKLAETVTTWEGEAGRAWLDRLPRLVAEVTEAWDLDVGPPLEPGGNISWVAPVQVRGGDEDLVLKVQFPHEESEPEAAALRAWAGAGAVRLHAHDPDRAALLIERCRPGHALVEGPCGADGVAAAGAEVAAILHAAPVPEEVPRLEPALARWADHLEGWLAACPEPLDGAVTAMVLDLMRTPPRAGARPVLLHGDLNPTNILSSARSPWLAIDPKPLVGDPTFDVTRIVTQPDPRLAPDPAAALARRLDIVAERAGFDRDALVRWCLVDVVLMAAWSRSVGDQVGADQGIAQTALILPNLA